MAATVQTIIGGPNRYVINVRGGYAITDASADLTDSIILDISTITTGPAGPNIAPNKLSIQEIWWTINTYSYCLLEFDRGTDHVIDYFQGQGYMDFRPYGGKVDKGTGGTGDLILTTSGGGATATYSFLIHLKLKE